MHLSDIFGWTATVVFSLMYIPQIIKTIKVQSVKDISLPMFLMGFVANIIALIYSILIHQSPLQIKYAIALVVLAIYIGVWWKIYSKERSDVTNIK